MNLHADNYNQYQYYNKTPFDISNGKQVELLGTPNLLRVKLINPGISRAI